MVVPSRAPWLGLALVVAGGAAVLLLAAPSHAAETYWTGSFPNTGATTGVPTTNPTSLPSFAFSNSGAAAVTVTIYNSAGTTLGTLAVAPSSSATFRLNIPPIWGSRLGASGVFHAVANGPLEVESFAPLEGQFSNDATRLLPESRLGTTYRVVTYADSSNPTYVAIIATQPMTTVTFTSTDAVASGPGITAMAAGATQTFTMNTGDMALLTTPVGTLHDLTGSLISADKPVAAYSGDRCVIISPSACDHTEEQLLPIANAGTQHVLCSVQQIQPTFIALTRIMALAPGTTTVTIAPVALTFTLSGPGAWIDTPLTADVVISSDQPVQVSAFLKLTSSGPGDPDLVTVMPVGALLSGDHPFYAADPAAPPGSAWTASYASIATPVTAVASLDAGSPLTWRTIAGTTWRCATAAVAPGYHDLSSTLGAYVQVLGFAPEQSYWYESMGVWPVVPPPPPPVTVDFLWSVGTPSCSSVAVTFTASSSPAGSIAAWSWNFGDTGTATGSPVVHTYAASGTYTVTLTATDTSGGIHTSTHPVTVTLAPPCPPTIDPMPTRILAPGQTLWICTTGHAGMGGTLSYSGIGIPQDAQFLAGPCLLWTPSEQDVGIWNCIQFTVVEAPSGGTASTCLPVHVLAVAASAIDTDRDGIADTADNCPTIPNHDQADADRDFMGDVCDSVPGDVAADPTTRSATRLPDRDQDGILDAADNCPAVANHDQADLDGDGVGDLCDADRDGDGIADRGPLGAYLDDCPFVPDALQLDADGDGVGDACQDTPVVGKGDAASPSPTTALQAPPAGTSWMWNAVAAVVPGCLVVAGFALAFRRRREQA